MIFFMLYTLAKISLYLSCVQHSTFLALEKLDMCTSSTKTQL